mmetsp:Transcript_7393/g.8492  ORF Transcript_7393/g.8492 Transcript_7393/m.8492 type:complete len:397 (-) Transcript_7393:41-1231(-)|eukprot:CAMPEP_0184043148 /NCGR_PEP_ID=MMETSP0955-20130417/66759_1 /TAXON_ID=627963 /ORGANISM="Aplanochytrium sp, Strain PBS07" /LENGTH=396 /DNA_ID=CAMNT_0026334025 /DNA_START=134 /DNA_END=1324 /DNA_ORIENTATION=-
MSVAVKAWDTGVDEIAKSIQQESYSPAGDMTRNGNKKGLDSLKKLKLFPRLRTSGLLKKLSSILNVVDSKKQKKRKRPVTKNIPLQKAESSNLYPEIIGSRTTSILSREQQRDVMKALPYRKRVCFWQMVYGSGEDGLSIPRLIDSCSEEEETLVIVRTVHGDIFGVFVTETWRKRGGVEFYGTGESFIFSIRKNSIGNEQNRAKIYHWSGKNECFMSSSEQHIGIGAGNEGFAIYLDEAFSGHSRASNTFDNPSLISTDEDGFTVQTIEVFCFPACKAHAEHTHIPEATCDNLLLENARVNVAAKPNYNTVGTTYNQYNNTLQGADAAHMLALYRHECGAYGRHVLKSDNDTGNHCATIFDLFPEINKKKKGEFQEHADNAGSYLLNSSIQSCRH